VRIRAPIASIFPVELLAGLVPWEKHSESDPVVALADHATSMGRRPRHRERAHDHPVRIFLRAGPRSFRRRTLLLAARECDGTRSLVDL
jgi:hypothetical protein